MESTIFKQAPIATSVMDRSGFRHVCFRGHSPKRVLKTSVVIGKSTLTNCHEKSDKEKNMAAQTKNSRKKSQTMSVKLDSNDVDVEHIVQALGRIHNPATRYFLSMMIDALTEDLAQIESGQPPTLLTRARSN